MTSIRCLMAAVLVGSLACRQAPSAQPPEGIEWSAWGADLGGSKYSELRQVNRHNVRELEVAWTTQVGDAAWPSEQQSFRFEVTPLFWRGNVIVSTPHSQVLALDPGDGSIRWRFDAGVDVRGEYAEGLTSRGVAVWTDPGARDGICSDRIIATTVTSELVALDVESGVLCPAFGDNGVVRLRDGAAIGGYSVPSSDYSVTSPPIVVRNLIIVGSSVRTTSKVGAASGVVRAYDAASGAPRWRFDPIPRNSADPRWFGWTQSAAKTTGGANVWGVMAADEELGIVYLPTGSAGPNSYGGLRPGQNQYANSVVAVNVETGSVVWSFQAVHHDLWDYDVAAQPVLARIRHENMDIPAVLVATKSGALFVLDRKTGDPLIPVEELPVPASDVPGEMAWPTQPFPTWPVLVGRFLSPDSAFGITAADRGFCRERMTELRNEGTFTPPSLGGTIVWPGYWGGINWDGISWDPVRRVVVLTVKRLATTVELIPRDSVGWAEPSRQPASPYGAVRRPLVAPSGVPCTPPPWSLLVAIEMDSREVVWTAPVGAVPGLAHIEGATDWGSLSFGGAVVTAGDLVFVAASEDGRIRALDEEDGRVLWEAELPAGGQATPMTYLHDGRQHIVIAAGGRGGIGHRGDWVVAYKLREQ